MLALRLRCARAAAGRLSRSTCRITNDHTKYRVRDLAAFLEGFISHEVQEPEHRKLLIVRHGQSFGNLRELYYGSTDFELTEKGKAQAGQIRDNLKPLLNHVDVAIASGLKRSQETAKVVFGLDTPAGQLQHGHSESRGRLRFRVDRRFNEFDLGGLECLDLSALSFAEREFMDRLYLEGRVSKPGLERPEAVLARLKEGLSELRVGENNILVGHYGTVHLLLNQMDFFGVGINTGDCVHLELCPDGTPYQLVAYWAK
jgi:broad specificity phosphatase PhoE